MSYKTVCGLSIEAQKKQIEEIEIPALLDQLPSDSWHGRKWEHDEIGWRFVFKTRSSERDFFAQAHGSTPWEAFLIVRYHIESQIKYWHSTRFLQVPVGYAALPVGQSPKALNAPLVLIVDDDVDLALSLRNAFEKFGCQTEIATKARGLYKKIATSDADYIFLDWKLNNQLTADVVVERAVHMIDHFSNLRRKFIEHRPRIITHSVLGRAEISLPEEGRAYFNHLAHWQKPMPYAEVLERASDLLSFQ